MMINRSLNIFLVVIAFVFFCETSGLAQQVHFEKIVGNEQYETEGNYSNSPADYPSARMGYDWTYDNNGNIWLFGGLTTRNEEQGVINDLWKYDITVNQWAWIDGSSNVNEPFVFMNKGLESPLNKVPSRFNHILFYDAVHNELVLSGGANDYMRGHYFSTVAFDDLWTYSLDDNIWVYRKGSDRMRDSHDFIFFDYLDNEDISYSIIDPQLPLIPHENSSYIQLNDSLYFIYMRTGAIKEYNSRQEERASVIYHSNNRSFSLESEMDGDGRRNIILYKTQPDSIFLYGGAYWGFYYHGPGGAHGYSNQYQNDILSFNFETHKYEKLSQTVDASYGEKGIPSLENRPPKRAVSFNWTDEKGNVWMFGGEASGGFYRDVWFYNTTTKMWTWMDGPQGPQDYVSPEEDMYPHLPSIRMGAKAVNVNDSTAYVFGGETKLDNGDSVYLNDIWKITVTYSGENNP